MTPPLAWMLGWTIFAGTVGAAFLAIDLAGARPALLLVAMGGVAGMSFGAYRAALARRPADLSGAWRQAAAWAAAGVFAFGLFAISFETTGRAEGGQLPPEYRAVMRLLVWFGAVGGFLGVTAAERWALPFWAFVRGILSAVIWSALVLGGGVACLFGIYYLGGAWLFDAMGPAGVVVAGIVSGLGTGVFIGSLGEATNRLTFRFRT